MFFKKKKVDISLLIKKEKFSKASSEIALLIKSEKEIFNCLNAWYNINLGLEFNKEDIKINEDLLPEEFFETIRVYYFLMSSSWPKNKITKYLKASKNIILQISLFIRNNIYDGVIFDPELRENLQHFILFVEKQNLLKDKADLSAIKAQLSGSLLQLGLIEKDSYGTDMLQYAESYEGVGLEDKSIDIYKAIVNDFESQSKKLSSGLFPEIRHADEPTEADLEIIKKAKESLNRLLKNN